MRQLLAHYFPPTGGEGEIGGVEMGYKTWSPGPGQSSMALPVKIASCFGVLEEEKFQITNVKYQTNNNDRNSKFKTCFGHLVLEFEICL